jgi:hypothetical protein
MWWPRKHRHVIDPRSLDDAGRRALRDLLAAAEAQGLIGPASAEVQPWK